MCLGPGLSERHPQTILGGSKFSWWLVCKSSRYVGISDETICLRVRPLKPLQPKGICLLKTLLSKKHNHHIHSISLAKPSSGWNIHHRVCFTCTEIARWKLASTFTVWQNSQSSLKKQAAGFLCYKWGNQGFYLRFSREWMAEFRLQPTFFRFQIPLWLIF